ncbi:hypothetical protein BN2497_9043 [Janthinobacterium sp. CG23_2]|nr:hypothetical protein BN2497_9043 [Janthinobacterium sp. CG23_2]CUU30919.1 hypothetical protein BN3177_9043 [Janthinobacterium sp. CG23_2]
MNREKPIIPLQIMDSWKRAKKRRRQEKVLVPAPSDVYLLRCTPEQPNYRGLAR